MFSSMKARLVQVSKRTKRAGTNKKHASSTIKSLPHDLLLEVVSRVASRSFTDLFNVKLCCKDFHGAAKEDYIYQHVSMDKFSVVPWWRLSEGASSFIERCKENGNAEALYGQGMVEYFSSKKQESGLENLKRAAEKGHIDASYMYGIILFCAGGESRQEALKLLSSLKSRGLRIKHCRERNKAIVKSMWINNYIVHQQDSSCHAKTCNNRGRVRDYSFGWPLIEEEENSCDSCLWDREVNLFCSMFTRR